MSQSSTAAALEMIRVPLLGKRVQHNMQAESPRYRSQQGSYICPPVTLPSTHSHTIYTDICSVLKTCGHGDTKLSTFG